MILRDFFLLLSLLSSYITVSQTTDSGTSRSKFPEYSGICLVEICHADLDCTAISERSVLQSGTNFGLVKIGGLDKGHTNKVVANT